MKPLTSQKVQRGNGTDPASTLNEWEKAEAQNTLEGLSAFAQRQRDRIKAAQAANEAEKKLKVRILTRGKG